MLEGTIVADEVPEVVEDGKIRIKGQVSEDETECTLMISRDILTGFSWHFGSEQEASGSALASAEPDASCSEPKCQENPVRISRLIMSVHSVSSSET